MTRFRYRLGPALLALALATAACDGGQGQEANSSAGEITIALPPATPLNNIAETANASDATNTAEPAPAEEETPSPVAPPPEPEEKEDPAPAAKAEADAAPEPAVAEPVTPAAPAETQPAAGAAAAPLPAATMASTIRRIGYPCPSVVSSEAAGGSYRITCSSGDVYRGTRRNGRFLFRPWSRP